MIRDPFKGGGAPDPSNPDSSCPAQVHNKTNWYNPCAFANPPAGSTIPRTGTGSLVTGTQEALLYLGEQSQHSAGARIPACELFGFKGLPRLPRKRPGVPRDAFNLLNTPTYAIGSTSDGPTGGLITGTQSFQNNTPDARFFQLSAKLKFE